MAYVAFRKLTIIIRLANLIMLSIAFSLTTTSTFLQCQPNEKHDEWNLIDHYVVMALELGALLLLIISIIIIIMKPSGNAEAVLLIIGGLLALIGSGFEIYHSTTRSESESCHTAYWIVAFIFLIISAIYFLADFTITRCRTKRLKAACCMANQTQSQSDSSRTSICSNSSSSCYNISPIPK